MGLKSFNPYTASRRFITVLDKSHITKQEPEKALLEPKKRSGGRNNQGEIVVWHRGGGHKKQYRQVDFRRDKVGVPAKVAAIEYDPGRSSRLALLQYKDGEKAYIIAPAGLQVGAKLMSGPSAPPEVGNSLPLRTVPVGLPIHNIELTPGRGAQMVRTAGGAATLMSRDEGYAQVRLPSGEIRRINENCYATIGQVGNAEHENVVLGKAGRSRHRGIRPINRGVEIDSEIADSGRSVILEQVTNGIAVRMAVLFLVNGGKGPQEVAAAFMVAMRQLIPMSMGPQTGVRSRITWHQVAMAAESAGKPMRSAI